MEETLRRADEALAQGNFMDAVTGYREILGSFEWEKMDKGDLTPKVRREMALEGSLRARLANALRMMGRLDEAEREFKDVLDIAGTIDDMKLLAEGDLGVGFVWWRRGLFKDSRGAFKKAFYEAQEVHDQETMGKALMGIGNVALVARRLEEGVEAYEEALDILGRIKGTEELCGRITHNLGFLYYCKGENERAEDMLKESLDTMERLGNIHTQGFAHINLARIYIGCGRMDEADGCLEKAGILLAKTNDKFGLSLVVWVKGLYKAGKGDLDGALEEYDKARRTMMEIGLPVQLLHMTVDYIPVFKETGRTEECLGVLEGLKVELEGKKVEELRPILDKAFADLKP